MTYTTSGAKARASAEIAKAEADIKAKADDDSNQKEYLFRDGIVYKWKLRVKYTITEYTYKTVVTSEPDDGYYSEREALVSTNVNEYQHCFRVPKWAWLVAHPESGVIYDDNSQERMRCALFGSDYTHDSLQLSYDITDVCIVKCTGDDGETLNTEYRRGGGGGGGGDSTTNVITTTAVVKAAETKRASCKTRVRAKVAAVPLDDSDAEPEYS